MSSRTVIYPARKIITMYPEQPWATAVAVKEGRILAVGDLNEVVSAVKNSPFTPYEVDPTFQDRILMPGLVDAHTHVELQAFIYSGHFVAQIPWPRPEGGFYLVYPTKADVLGRLSQLDAELPPGKLLYGVAYDENKAGGGLTLAELDQISTRRPILVSNLVCHRFWVNSFLLNQAGIGPGHMPAGVQTGPDGRPSGTLLEFAGLLAVWPAIPDLLDVNAAKIRRILPLFTAGGNTTVCDAAFGALGFRRSLDLFRGLFSDAGPKLRVVGLPWAVSGVPEAGSLDLFIDMIKKAREEQTDKVRIGAVKLYTDGSIVSRTSPIGWPGYWDGTPEPHMAGDPETIRQRIISLHQAGWSTVTHANSRPGCQIALEAIKEAQQHCYRQDMRHRIDHCYGINEAQLRLARELGVTIQFFSTHIYYYGDAHLRIQGPDRARHITPVGTAKRLGVSWGLHNDPPGTPQLPWVAAWTAVHRQTMETNTVLGEKHRVTVPEVLRAITLEAAYQLHLDHEIGSIEFGKRADFCVLEADPLTMDPMDVKDMPVWGTVFGGELNPAK